MGSIQLGCQSEWGLVISGNGRLGAGLGRPAVTGYSPEAGFNDVVPHVVVFAKSGSEFALIVDGQVNYFEGAGFEARLTRDMIIGSVQSLGAAFNGDIAELRFYDGAVSVSEASELSLQMVSTYGGNIVPRPASDAYSVDEDQTLVVFAEQGVLSNDADLNGESLTVVLDQLTTNGIIELDSDGAFVYASATDFQGQDQCSYIVSDGIVSRTAQVSLDIVSVYDPATTVTESFVLSPERIFELPVAQGLLLNDINADGTELVATLVRDVTDGVLDLRPNGSLTYDPGAFQGVTTFFLCRARFSGNTKRCHRDDRRRWGGSSSRA